MSNPNRNNQLKGTYAIDNQTRQQDYYVFAGSYANAQQEGIQLLIFDTEHGSLKRLGAIADVENPAFLALDPVRNRFFAVSEVVEGQVIAYSVDLQSGKIEEINRQSTQGASPCHLSIDPTGSWLFTVNYTSGSVCLFPIDEYGSIGPLADFIQHRGSSTNLDRQKEPHPHSIFGYPNSSYLFVPDLGTDQIYVYKFDTAEQKLKLITATPTTPGSGPRHLAFHPSKPYVYIIQELASTVAVYAIDRDTFNLTLLQTISTLPSDFSGESMCADIHISPCGQFLYGSNRGDDSIATFGIVEDGTLKWEGHTSTQGQAPRNFALLPDGKHMLVANQESDSIIVMSIDTDGVPIPTGEHYEMVKPVCLKVLSSLEKISKLFG
ncbi:MAG: lactonase family protein [Paenibacillaceae bacterium]